MCQLNFLAILGDFSARLGLEDALYTYHDITNRNGMHLSEFMIEHQLFSANTQFRKKSGKRWTFRDRGTRTTRQLDYILVRRKCRNSILNRLRSAIDPHIRDNQNGFRERRSTTSHILALRRIIEEVKSNNLTAILTFIDFRKAFDSIHRGKMVKILKAYGVPSNLLRALQSMYSGTRAKVVTPNGNTDEFDILAGVMQGDTLAPFIFIVVLDFALRRAISGHEVDLGFTLTPRRSSRYPAVA